MNPLLIFWLHKYHDKVHNGRQLAIKVPPILIVICLMAMALYSHGDVICETRSRRRRHGEARDGATSPSRPRRAASAKPASAKPGFNLSSLETTRTAVRKPHWHPAVPPPSLSA